MQSESIFRTLLLCYPAAFRNEYGGEMRHVFREELADARRAGSWFAVSALWFRTARDLILIAPKEHYHVLMQDIQYSLRNLAGNPSFAIVAILSLALGIGANTAIFSLWNAVSLSSLPVNAPEQLVMLSDPDSSGVSIGSSTGERPLLTNNEFEQLRDHAQGFAGMMASQSSLDAWQIRIDGGGWEEAKGRLVSGSYFQVLSVSPLMGRTFSNEDDRAKAPLVVVSHNFWKNRLSSRTDVLGKRITIRKAVLSIVGVAPEGFHGETSSQNPDLWAPLSAQPEVLPGRDWLHDKTSEKVMWLHVFGRLRSGVTMQQAEGSANAVFKAGLESHYGSVVSEASRREFLDQKLKLRPASAGASQFRGRFADPLQLLLAAVGMVLLISCANVANLLLARGAARRKEMELRLSLGASRSRLVRQLMTESLVLATAGGVAGLGVAYLLQRVLVRLVSEADQSFHMSFSLDPRVLGFTVASTLIAAIVFGLLPAWLGTAANPGAGLKGEGRSSTSSSSQLRWGRMLVAGQLALSLPLLVGAGLLVRTLYNLQHVDLGYAGERLLVLRVDAQTGGYQQARRPQLFDKLAEQIRLVPRVQAVSYSENGLFSGSDSGDEIEVEGYKRKGKNDQGSRWDQVGPGYFSTVGVPLIAGREINETDQETSLKVCVINEAFAKLFFEGRNPLGMHITTIFGDTKTTHEVVGITRNIRTHRIRGEVDPRYFVPLKQPLGDAPQIVFTIRTTGDPDQVLSSARQAINRIDGTLPITQAGSLELRLSQRMAQDRILARLAAAFGLMALALAAVGLYGVLSYGVERRRAEIGIRMALGAEPGRVIGMILRETSWLVVGGLVVGSGLAVAASRLITSQLFGLAPHDPLTLSLAVTVLLLVTFGAAYLPARRAARLDPAIALRQD